MGVAIPLRSMSSLDQEFNIKPHSYSIKHSTPANSSNLKRPLSSTFSKKSQLPLEGMEQLSCDTWSSLCPLMINSHVSAKADVELLLLSKEK